MAEVTRLSRAQRHDQLVALGMRMVAASSFDAVSVDDVAAAAGISRSLLFHYFPTKQDFFVAIARSAAEELLAATAPDPGLDPVAALGRGITAFVDYVAGRPDAYVSLVRGADGREPGLREVHEATRAAFVSRLVDGLGLSQPGDVVVVLALRGYVGFAEEVVVTWLQDGDATRDEVVDLLLRAAVGLLGALGLAVPSA